MGNKANITYRGAQRDWMVATNMCNLDTCVTCLYEKS